MVIRMPLHSAEDALSLARSKRAEECVEIAKSIVAPYWADDHDWRQRDRACTTIYWLMRELHKGKSFTFECPSCGEEQTVLPVTMREREE